MVNKPTRRSRLEHPSGDNGGEDQWQRLNPEYERPSMVHGIPNCLVTIDGESRFPLAVQEFNGSPLFYVWDHSDQSPPLRIFSSIEGIHEFLGIAEVPPELNAGFPGNERIRLDPRELSIKGYVSLYDDPDYTGEKWIFYADWGGIPDFTHVYPTAWWSTNINDRVSSVRSHIYLSPYQDPRLHESWLVYTILHEHVDYKGSQLWLRNLMTYRPDGTEWWDDKPNLGSIGWDDRASSMSYSYHFNPRP